jgi:protein SCO1/2
MFCLRSTIGCRFLGALASTIIVCASSLLLSTPLSAALQSNDSANRATSTQSFPENDPLGLQVLPSQAQGIGIDSQEGRIIDGDVTFYDSEGRLVRFGDLFKSGKKPIMLSFNYSSCPKLCSVQLENITLALREVDLEVGKDFEYVSLSIDPNESVPTAKTTKEKYVTLYNRPQSVAGWHFLTGKKENIDKLADQCGFRYKYIPEQKDYSHLPAILLISPEREIVRYLPGLDYDPSTIRLALIETAAGKIGSPVDWAAYSLGCYSFNSTMGKYSFQAMALMRIGGLVTIAALLVGLIPYWFIRNNRQTKDRTKGSDLDVPGRTSLKQNGIVSS